MSYTQTCVPSSKIASTSTILLTPRKKKRLAPNRTNLEESTTNAQGLSQTPAKDELLYDRITRCRESTTHSSSELYKWTFNRAAMAPVRVRHVFEMDRGGTEPEEFYWMGRVPCRTVKLVGMVVGIDEFDDTTRFKLDDGTDVIDCDIKRPKYPKQRAFSKATIEKSTSKSTGPESSKQALLRQDKPPIAPGAAKVCVGNIISVRGRIFHGRGTRYLRLEPDGFSLCRAASDEPFHWMEVNRLCREYYYLLEPFAIPKVELKPQQPSASSSNEPVSAAPSSPVSLISSPARSESSHTSATPRHPRLRHPSRLHSRDLTDITFRIYLKHYMDFAYPYRSAQTAAIKHEDDTDNNNDPFSTPTPKSRYRRYSSLETPKPCRHVLSLKQNGEDETAEYGFTLSYLRRVPVLSEMARSVVRAEAKRREKAKMKQEKDKNSQNTQTSSSSSTSLPKGTSRSASGGELDPKLLSINTKRLFQKTIRDLYKDGSIIIWDGPARSCEHAAYANDESIGGSQGLWKTKDSQPSPTNTTASSVCCESTQDDLDGSLSDPDENEESYLPVSPRIIAPFVMRALHSLTGPGNALRKPLRKYRPPTVDELTSHLQKSDGRWNNLGSWDVQAALEWLQNEDQVFKAGDGRWAICS